MVSLHVTHSTVTLTPVVTTIGNPTKIMRYYKFKALGYKEADEETKRFIIKQALTYKNSEMNCRYQLEKGVMNGMTDSKAQSKKQAFKQVIIEDLGQMFWDDNFE
jgi:hypothetical protein